MATTTVAPTQDRISFAEPREHPRMSTGSGSNGSYNSSNPDEHYEDWSKTTSEKDSWAYRQRRLSNKFSTIDNDMAKQMSEKEARRRSGRHGSVLGIFQQGVDKNGNPSVLSDDHHDDLDVDPELLKAQESPKPTAITIAHNDPRRLSATNSDGRRGSILSLWKGGKDKDGNDLMHSSGPGGKDMEDWETAVSTTGSNSESGPPDSPNPDTRGDRRGSILSIWRQGKDRSGNAVIHSGEVHDADAVPHEDDGAPLEQVISATSSSSKGKGPEVSERRGSILSIWSQGKDKDGKPLILSGGELDDVSEIPVEVVKVENLRGGKDRKGSILSMWAEEGRERDAVERPGKVAAKFEDVEE